MKRIAHISLVILLIIALTACQTGKAPTQQGSSPATASRSSGSAQGQAPTEPPKDVTLTIFRTMKDEGVTDKEVIAEVEKRFGETMNDNFKLDMIYLAYSEHTHIFERLSMMMATNEPLDLYSFGSVDFNTKIPQPGFVAPIRI